MTPRNSTLAYSTDGTRVCPRCGKLPVRCWCEKKSEASKGDGVVRVGRETKGRKGKSVTVVTGISLGEEELRQLATMLKRKCGSGGTLKNGVIEIQGDHRDSIVTELEGQGFAVKRAGG